MKTIGGGRVSEHRLKGQVGGKLSNGLTFNAPKYQRNYLQNCPIGTNNVSIMTPRRLLF